VWIRSRICVSSLRLPGREHPNRRRRWPEVALEEAWGDLPEGRNLGNFIPTHRVTLDICRHGFQQFFAWRKCKFHGLCVGEDFRYDKHDETGVPTIAISPTISCVRIRSCCARCFSFV
jgi:hypothetical protein